MCEGSLKAREVGKGNLWTLLEDVRGSPDPRGSRPQPGFVWMGNFLATNEDQQCILKTIGSCACFLEL